MIKFNDLNAQWLAIKDQAMPEIEELLKTSQFILGPQVERFEKVFASYSECKYGIGVSNGTDAIKIAAKALGLKHNTHIFMPANTFVATYLAAKEAYPNAKIHMIDIYEDGSMNLDLLQMNIDQVNSNAIIHNESIDKLVIAVHMFGNCDNLDKIYNICTDTQSKLLEDASQAHGAMSLDGNVAGSVGDISVFSFYPGKNLGAAGDAGIIVTNHKNLYDKCQLLRNYGSTQKYIHVEEGYNHRLDTIQAIILYHKLHKLDGWNSQRKAHAAKIIKGITCPLDATNWITPMQEISQRQVYHILPILVSNKSTRPNFITYLTKNNIPHGIHYPIPIHKMSFYSNNNDNLPITESYADRMVSLPIHPFLSDTEINSIINTINQFETEK